MGDAYVELHNEIKQAYAHYLSGHKSEDESYMALRFFSARRKVLDKMVAIRMFAFPDGGKPFVSNVGTAQLFDETDKLELLPRRPDDEIVMCRVKDQTITRSDCLDYSGEAKHQDECRGCEAGLITKRFLCPSGG